MYRPTWFNRAMIFTLCISIIFSSLQPALPVRGAEAANIPTTLDQVGTVIADAGIPFAADSTTADSASDVFMSAGSTLFGSPLSISRMQSAYNSNSLVDSTLVVTFTVQNTLPPVNLPVIPESATLTDTLELIQAVDYENDPNTIRNVILADQFVGNVSVVESNPMADTDDESHLWNMGDIPPLGTAEVAVRLQVEDSDLFLELDNGMQAWGTLYGRSATANAAPIRLVPTDFSQWLIWTMDTDYHDQYMLTKLSEVGTTADEIFGYVQSLGYEVYDGSLRGTRGTLWSEAGNAVDLSSLMIAMLRASGIPARYRHGTLAETERATVILSMFPSVGARGGVVTEDVITFDPAADPELLETVTEHWWVEAFAEGQGWVAYDPTVPDATVGETFATDIADAMAELPDALRHKVNVRLRVENYHPLNISGPMPGLDFSYPLEYTIRTVSVIGQPVQMSHVVDSNIQGGLVFSNRFYRYTPYLIIGEEEQLVTGETYEDLLTNFPLGTTVTTGSWLEFEVQFPDGTVEHYEREIFDHIGYEARHGAPGAHQLDLSGLNEGPSIGEQSTYTFLLDSSRVSFDAINARFGEMVEAATTAQESAAAVEALVADENTSDSDLPLLRAAAQKVTDATELGQATHLLTYAAVSDLNTEQLGRTSLIKGYHNAPRILTVGWNDSTDEDNVTVQFDLTRNAIQTVPYPGQTEVGLQAFNFARGLYEASIEGIIMEQFSGRQVRSVHHIFEEAARQNVSLHLITPANRDELADLQISDIAKARILTTLERSSEVVVVPGQMVTLGNEETIGWYEINTETGITIDTMENGQHVAAIVYAKLTGSGFQRALFKFIGFFHGFSAHTLVYIGEVLAQAPFTSSDAKGVLEGANGAADARVDEIEDALKAPKKTLVGAFVKGLDKGSDLAETYINSTIDPPIPEAYYSRSIVNFSEEVVIWTTGTFPAALSDSGLDITVSAENTYLTGNTTTSYDTNGKNSASYDRLTIANVTTPSGSGTLTLENGGALLNNNTISVETESTVGSHSFYAPAVTGMAHGTGWKAYSSTITPSAEDTFTIHNAKGSLGNTAIDEALLQITTGDPLELSGSGATHAASFATTVDAALNNSGLILGPSNTYPNGLAGWNMTGDVAITENGDTDSVVLNSTGSFFTLDVAPAAVTIEPLQTATFQSTIAGNVAADYRLYLFLPSGWRGSLSPSGAVELTPSLDTAPGDYTTRVVAQVVDQPHIMLMAEQAVSVTQIDGVSVEITPDPYHTVPLGEVQTTESLENNGQIQLSDSAYNIAVHNTSSIPRQFTVSISEVDPAWLIFDGSYGDTEATLFLGSDEIATFGLYIEPPADPLPEVGTTFPIQVNVAAVDDPTVTADHSTAFVMPGIAYGYMQSGPDIQYVAVGDTARVDLHVENVGNAAGTFAITTTVETADSEQTLLVDPIVTQLEIDPSATNSTQVAVDTTDAVVGQQYAVQSMLKNGPYRPISAVLFEIVSAEAGCLYRAATTTSNYDELLTAALVQLGDDINDLAAAPEESEQLTQALSSLDTFISLLPQQVDRQPLIQARDTLPASLETLCTTLAPVTDLLTLLGSTAYSARLSPGSYTALQGEIVTYTLTLANNTNSEIAYQVTTTALDEVEQQALTLAAQQMEQIGIPIVADTLGMGTVAADVVVLESGTPITYTATQRTAALNVVDSLIQVVAVTANPAFVESGSSTTDLSMEVMNVANRTLPATIDVEVVAEDGTTLYSNQLTQTLNANGVARYDLANVDTSGWETGNYRIQVEITDEQGEVIPSGIGEGFLVVGAALQAFHSVSPAVVAPGDVTVTALISTMVTLNQTPAARSTRNIHQTSNWVATGLRSLEPTTHENVDGLGQMAMENREGENLDSVQEQMAIVDASADQILDTQAMEAESYQLFVPKQSVNNAGIIRYEELHPELLYNGVPFTQTTGGWSTRSGSNASSGGYVYSDTVSDTIQLTFEGSWVNIGFFASSSGGIIEIFLDGVSQGTVDLYANHDIAKEIQFANLNNGTHTIELVKLDEKNQFLSSSRHYLALDYIDVWDGTAMPEGDFAENDPRVQYSSDWQVGDIDEARDGSYLRRGSRAWFPFTGNSVSFHTLAYSSGGEMEIFIDGESQGFFSAYNLEPISRTLSFDGFEDGPHMMLVQSYRGRASIDGFSSPSISPAIETVIPTGIIHYEENHPDLLYNDLPFNETSTSWSMLSVGNASNAYYAYSKTLSDTMSLSFEGSWIHIGLLTSPSGGKAEILIDGVSQEIIDLYSENRLPLSRFYPNLEMGTHKLEIFVLGEQNPESSDHDVYIDFIDIWDDTNIPSGWYNPVTSDQISLSNSWRERENSIAQEDTYLVGRGGYAWFRFTGDSVTYLAMSDSSASKAEVFIDGVSHGIVDSHYRFSNSPLPFHYTDLGEGPHILQIKVIENGTIDAFEVNPTELHLGVPMVEWSEPIGTFYPMTAGDLDGNGTVEILVSSVLGLYVYNGDGSDAGDGTPLLWHIDTRPNTPVLVDLDGEIGAEIVVGGVGVTSAYHHDGTLYWSTDIVRAGSNGVAAANMDDDPQPEIIVAGDVGCPCVLEHDGTLAWRYGGNYFNSSVSPTIADLTGDGKPDILTIQDDTLYLIDYGINPPELAWSLKFTTDIESSISSSPSIADVDGLQPGGDLGPEITLVENGFVHLIDADGTLLWSYPTGEGSPGGTSIADTDGDGEVEIVASAQVDGGKLYVLNADGTLLWEKPALDGTSANNVSVLDLDGNGAWEIIWNGFNQGLTIYQGSNGEVLFNEPRVASRTASDYPIIADVDQDGAAEIITTNTGSLYVIGHDQAWGPSRPLWNQFNYHITNINDDLTIPVVEPNSWEVHNTYRTQTPFQVVLPNFQVSVTHVAATSQIDVLQDTFTYLDTVEENNYRWSYQQVGQTTSNQFDTFLSDMQPGEIRQLSEETIISYQYSGGSNTFRLPPLYVMAERIIALSPTEQTANPASTATYDITLHNPATVADTYTLEVLGLPKEWVSLPRQVEMAGQSTAAEQLQINVPADADLADYPFAVRVANQSGGQDQSEGVLTIVDAFSLAVAPQLISAQSAQPLSYTVTITNLQPTNRTYSLTVIGMDPTLISYPTTVDVPANSDVAVPLNVIAPAQQGSHLFEVLAQTPQVQAMDMAGVTVEDERSVEIRLRPATQTTGRGFPALFTVSVTNTGSVADTYDLQVALPPEWSALFDANGITVTELELSPYLFNATDVTLLVMPPADAASGDYDFTITAQSQQHSAVQSSISGTVNVLEQGVTIELTPETQTVSPDEAVSWDVIVTNSGTVADTFVLTSTGVIAGMAEFSTDRLTLEPNQSETVQVTAANFNEVTMKRYLVGVVAQSQSADEIRATDTGELLFSSYEDVELTWRPDRQTITATSMGPYVTDYLLSITNHGNVAVNYDLTFLADTLQATPELDQVYIFPKMTSVVLVTVVADESGTYEVEGVSISESGDSRDSEMAFLEITSTPTALQQQVEPEENDHFLYLPILFQADACTSSTSSAQNCGRQSDTLAVHSATHLESSEDTQVVYLPILFR